MTGVTSWLVYLLGVQGLVYLVSASVIFIPVRLILARISIVFRALLYCPSCASFWLGMSASYFAPFYDESLPWFGNMILSGVVTMGVTSLLSTRGFIATADYEVENGSLRRDEDASA